MRGSGALLARRLSFAARQLLRWPASRLAQWFLMRGATGAQICGLDVSVNRDLLDAEGPESARQLFDHVRRALTLLEDVQPRLLARMRRDVRRAFIGLGPYCAYWSTFRTILLGSRSVRTSDATYLASVFVHEAVHARFYRRGIRMWPDLEARIERRCLLEQIAFVECIEGGESLAADLRQWLDRPWWTAEHLAARAEEVAREVKQKLDQ